jgi:very-long-chain ceramide synthase
VLNYLDSPIVFPFFGVFFAVWTYLRHYLNLRILYSILTEFRTVGPFVLDWETQQYKCWISQLITFTLLAGLQLINLFWLAFILRIAWRLAASNVAKDDRSDDEDEEDEDRQEDGEALQQQQQQQQKKVEEPKTPEIVVNGRPIEENGSSTPNGSSTRSLRSRAQKGGR